VVEDLGAYAAAAFGWPGNVAVSAGPRGALGQIWRVETDAVWYALKEIFDEPPTEASIQVELDFARRASESGVRVPASHPDRRGRYLVTTPDGRWLRCYDWIDLRPIAQAADTPPRLGTLLAQLHRCAPAGTVEPNGGKPADPWYDRVPTPSDWAELAVALAVTGASWAPRVAGRLSALPQLGAEVRPVDPARLVICHRDLHWENVHVDPAGALVVVDWDDLGPAEPGQELARALFDWCCDDARTDLDAVRAMVDSYLGAGGPGRVTAPGDFSMLLASRQNYLLSQARLALDPHTEPRHRQWAEGEIDLMLRIMPTPGQLAEVLEVTRDCFR
jgi:Ser/Thr protein kinase RdoA (MazF antagonist)